MNRKSLIGKLSLGIVGVLSVLIIILGMLRVYDTVAKRLPVSQSRIHLAQAGLTKNADWKPTIRHFSNLDWALVPSGCFHLGSTETQFKEALNACKVYGGEHCPFVFDMVLGPRSQVCLEKPYWMGITEVTNRQYGSSSSTDMVSMYRGPEWPRETVTWQEAEEFCESINSRLPTEAEWEYAARGPDGLIYPWGNEMSSEYKQQATLLNPVDVRSVNADVSWVGAQGIAGNVAEWVDGFFDPSSSPASFNPNFSQVDHRIARGGSWASYADFLLRTTQRIPYEPEYASSVIGFRCVHDF